MIKYLKNMLDHVVETIENDMMDILSYNCNNLMNQIGTIKDDDDIIDGSAAGGIGEAKRDTNQIIMDYLEKIANEHKPIKDFKEDLDWFNVTEPLSLRSTLQGKIVILDFFTYCCINCNHILPDLKRIEQLYSVEDGVVIIGVHSAKFSNEKDSANILSAVQRYDITHPVVNDSSLSMWNDLKIKCWPTLLILGPFGNPLFVLMGEGHYPLLKAYVDASINYYKNIKQIDVHSLPLNPATDLIMASHLKFPGKIACSKSNNNNYKAPVVDPKQDDDYDDCTELYAISDTGNHRILVINKIGLVLYKIGGKQSGFKDGDFNTVRFNSPQGLTFSNGNNCIYVADTENHAIRKINLKIRMVETIAGTGRQGDDRIGGKIGILQEISSPWDVSVYRFTDMPLTINPIMMMMAKTAAAATTTSSSSSTTTENGETLVKNDREVLLIAMAGTHQIWAIFLDTSIWWKSSKHQMNTVISIAGNGNEENRNNSYPKNAAFAQPSGLSISYKNRELYIADSESSTVRKLSLTDGRVMGMVGGDRDPLNLFAFGDSDGMGTTVKLQHPLGVAYNSIENCVYVADTYNHKIKKINCISNEMKTMQCFEQPIYDNGDDDDDDDNFENDYNAAKVNKILYQFNEPGGLCLNPKGNILYVADTNNHCIKMIDIQSTTMEIRTMKLIFQNQTDDENRPTFLYEKTLRNKEIQLKCDGGKLNIQIKFQMDAIHLNADAQQQWKITIANDLWTIIDYDSLHTKQNEIIQNDKMSIVINIIPGIDNTLLDSETIQIGFKLNLCGMDKCMQKCFSVTFPITFDLNDNNTNNDIDNNTNINDNDNNTNNDVIQENCIIKITENDYEIVTSTPTTTTPSTTTTTETTTTTLTTTTASPTMTTASTTTTTPTTATTPTTDTTSTTTETE